METKKESKKKLIASVSILVLIAGILLVAAGTWGIVYTYVNVAREKIVAPEDAAFPEKPVRGPFTLKAQADIIRFHMLRTTGGKTFAEMPRQIPKVDENGKPVLDLSGKAVMTANTARDLWITATTLTTALNLALISYAVSALAVFLGIIFILIGILFYAVYARRAV